MEPMSSRQAAGRRTEPARAAGLALALLLAACAGRAAAQGSGTALEAAREHAAAGRVGAALRDFDAWLRSHPADALVLREAATYAFRTRRWFESARWLERYVAVSPEDPAGWFDLGALRHNQCRFELAIPAFRRLEALESTDPALARRADHRFLHGECARRLEQYGEAIAELELAVARAPDRADVRKSFAQALLDGGRFEAAAAEFKTVLLADPAAENHYGIGVALGEAGRIEEAIAALREARRIRSGDARTLLKLGTLSMRAKDLARAEAYLIEARSAAPRNVDVLFALAQAQRLQGRSEEAAETRQLAETLRTEADAAVERGRRYHRGLVAAPEDAAAHVRYGLDLLEQGRLDEAQVVLQRLLSFDPLNEVAILNLASLLARQGDPAAALEELAKLLEADEGHETANLQAARIKLVHGKVDAARTHLAAAAARNPASVEAQELLAAALRALGDAAGAARHEAEAARLAAAASRPAKD
jgi:tetratricopeptide (TPR) repeat protein